MAKELSTLKTSDRGLSLIKVREGVRQQAYRDSRGIWTIGVGHVTPPPYFNRWTRWSPGQVDQALRHDIARFEDAVNLAIKRPMTQNQFDAMVSLAFNIGTKGFMGSSVVKSFNSGNVEEAAKDFLLWDHPAELLGRRKSEMNQFLEKDV